MREGRIPFRTSMGDGRCVEGVRGVVGPSWKAYFNVDESFARYVRYLVSRCGAHNVVFSGIHLNWIPEAFSN